MEMTLYIIANGLNELRRLTVRSDSFTRGSERKDRKP